MPINNGVLSPYFSTRSIFLCPLATCNQRYYLPTTLPVQQLNIVQSQYPLFTIGRWTYKKTSMFARIFKSPPFTTSTLNDVFTYLPFSHISPNFDLHYSFVLADVVFTLKYHCHYSHGINWHPLTTTGEMLSQHGWQHLENQFCFPCFIAFGTSLSTMHIYTTWFSIRFILSFFQSHSV